MYFKRDKEILLIQEAILIARGIERTFDRHR